MRRITRLGVVAVLVASAAIAGRQIWRVAWNRALLAAAKNGDAEPIENAIRLGADVNARDRLGNTALVLSLQSGLLSPAEILLRHGADPRLTSSTGDTPLHYAARYRNLELMKAFLARGASPGGLDADGRTPLLELYTPGGLGPTGLQEGTELLLTAGADVNERGRDGMTPLLAALLLEADIKPLLEHGADANADHPKLGTPLTIAAYRQSGAEELIALLVRHNARLDDLDGTVRGATPLMHAVTRGNMHAVRALLAAGASADATALDGTTPLLVAVNDEKGGVVDLLLEHGAKPDAAGRDGRTPLRIAAERGSSPIAQALLRHGARRDAPGPDGATPAQVAARAGWGTLAAELSRPGAPVPSTAGDEQLDEEGCPLSQRPHVILSGAEGSAPGWLFDDLLFCRESSLERMEEAVPTLDKEYRVAVRAFVQRCRTAIRPVESACRDEETCGRIVREKLAQAAHAFTGSRQAADAFVKAVRPSYEWEGLAEAPLAEAKQAAALAAEKNQTTPYALAFALQRYRCAFGYACGGGWGSHEERAQARQGFADLLPRALSHPNPLVRLVALDLNAVPILCGGRHP